ncbi:hypothetical protein LINGRAHAP2_LOCUS23673 [Linum grandiflorum]
MSLTPLSRIASSEAYSCRSGIAYVALGNFQCLSANFLLKALVFERFGGVSDFSRDLVWYPMIPSKIVGLVWKMGHMNISTIDNLIKKGFHFPNRSGYFSVYDFSCLVLYRVLGESVSGLGMG